MRTRTRFITVLTTALLALAVTSGLALAAVLTPFSASGALTQTSAGAGATVPWGAAKLALAGAGVPAAIIGGVDAAIVSGGGDDTTPGALTTGQAFEGKFTTSTWGAVKRSDVAVAHNSWFTAAVDLLFPPYNLPAVPAVGVAFGGFDIDKKKHEISGSYAAVITGSVHLDFTCLAVTGSPLAVNITDAGGWAPIPGSAEGAFESIDPSGGGLVVTATGCIGAEDADLSITGAFSDDDEDDDDDRGGRGGRGDD